MTLRLAPAQGGPSGDDGGNTCDLQANGTIELYFYSELTPGEREGVDRHLAACAQCREALEELGEIRTALAGRPDVSAPESGDWSAFMERLAAAIDDREASTPGPVLQAQSSAHRYVAYLAMAALLVLVTLSVLFVARSRIATPPSQRVDITPAPAVDQDATASLAALSEEHLERSKLVVLGLAAKDAQHASGADWAYERKLASNLLNDTRLYRMAAEERGMTTVANVMRDLEIVLLQTSLSDENDAATLGQIQRLIQKRDLVGKMTVVTTRGL
jgi:hypothetical protein